MPDYVSKNKRSCGHRYEPVILKVWLLTLPRQIKPVPASNRRNQQGDGDIQQEVPASILPHVIRLHQFQ
jgi:hypothetical protein